MTLREALGGDVQRIYDHVDALLDKEDGIVALFDGSRVLTYAHGFGASASQLELLGVELERALHNVVGGRPARTPRRHRDRHQGVQRDRDVGGGDHRRARGVLQLARKIA